MFREITAVYKPEKTSDGPGAEVWRFIGGQVRRILPPFVACEMVKVDSIGRPAYPSRGLQKITVGIEGNLQIEYGNKSNIELGAGDVTSLMAGKGSIRSERAKPPGAESTDRTNRTDRTEQEADSRNSIAQKATALNILLDIPEEYKRRDGYYRLIRRSSLNELKAGYFDTNVDNSTGDVQVVSGELAGIHSVPLTLTPCTILNICLGPGDIFDWPIDSSSHAFLVSIDGDLEINGKLNVNPFTYAEFAASNPPYNSVVSSVHEYRDGTGNTPTSRSSKVRLRGVAKTRKTKVIAAAAQRLNQPIYHQGPFVDVSLEWIQQAFDDYSLRINGFERDSKYPYYINEADTQTANKED